MHLSGMKSSPDPTARRRLILLIACGVVALALIAFGAYGLITGPHHGNDHEAAPAPAPEMTTEPTVPPTAPRPQAPEITPTKDPEMFARRVAEGLFTWDTTMGLYPLDYTASLVNVGDPSGVEQAGLAADIAGYLPTRDAWIQLRTYETAQTLDITSVEVPAAWSEAIGQARPGQLPPGAAAYTVTGTRHRAGVWDGVDQAMSEDVSFTIFMACPRGDDCYLLRLSQLNNPLQ